MARQLLRFGLLLFLLSLLINPHHAYAKSKVNEASHLKQLEQSIQNEDWKKATVQVQALDKYYSDHLWRYQILGNKNEYGKLEDEIAKLKGAIKAKDKSKSLVSITYIRALYKQIYSP